MGEMKKGFEITTDKMNSAFLELAIQTLAFQKINVDITLSIAAKLLDRDFIELRENAERDYKTKKQEILDFLYEHYGKTDINDILNPSPE